MKISLIAEHFLIACLWADSPEGTKPRPSKAAKMHAQLMAAQFVNDAGQLLEQLREFPEYWAHPDCAGKIEAAIGHDLYLTIAGHGVGFWDRGLGDLGDKLSEVCRKLAYQKEPVFYRGWLYF